MKHLKTLISIFITVLFFSCNSGNEHATSSYKSIKMPTVADTLKKVNRFFIRKDKEQIESYIRRMNWNCIEHKSGLWYEIYKKGKGKKITQGERIQYKYRIELLDGTYCYSSDSTGIKVVTVGRVGEESGLEIALSLLKHGDKARFIMPPYMAHGATGDRNKIPAMSVIVYWIEVL